MSTLYFSSKTTLAEISGRERDVLNKIIFSALEPVIEKAEKDALLNSLENPEECNFKDEAEDVFKIKFKNALSGFFDFNFKLGDNVLTKYEMIGNTAFKSSDIIKLSVRIHYLCESHIYILPENFNWFSMLIKKALSTGLFTKNIGWESLIEDLKVSKTPIVTSFSGSDSFPNIKLSQLSEEEWNNKSNEERFKLSFNNIKNKELMELKPNNWDEFFFNKNISLYDI